MLYYPFAAPNAPKNKDGTKRGPKVLKILGRAGKIAARPIALPNRSLFRPAPGCRPTAIAGPRPASAYQTLVTVYPMARNRSMRPVLPARCSAPTAMNAPPEAEKSGAARSAMIALRLSSSSRMNSSFSRAFGLAHAAQARREIGEDFRRSAFPIQLEHGGVEVVVQARVSSGENEQRRGDFGAQGCDRVELLFGRFKSNDLHAFVFRRLSEKLIDLRQIERFAFCFAGGNRSQDGEKPRLHVMREFSGIACPRNEFLNSLTVLRGNGALERVMVAIERLSQRRRGDVGLLDGIHWPAELGRHNSGAVDQLCGAPGDFERGTSSVE